MLLSELILHKEMLGLTALTIISVVYKVKL